MPAEITRVKTDDEIDIVTELAKEIWTEHFTPIIGKSQVDYMLDKFQSSKAIKSQTLTGYEYYLATAKNNYVGYTALVPDIENNKMMISKLYTLSSIRGKGVGAALLSFIECKCVSGHISTIWLTVNKYNHGPIAWYQRHGFNIVDKTKTDIGGGFFMDDYIMEKHVR
jgi:GNAT superfamily N-acetyltransferase